MKEMKMGNVASKFADIIWENSPITSAYLARLAEAEMGWKKTTAYTVLKRLCAKGIFEIDHGIVKIILTKEQFRTVQSQQFIDEKFDGSVAAFIAAYSEGRTLTKEDVDALKKLIAAQKK